MRKVLVAALLFAGSSPSLAAPTHYDAFSTFSGTPGATGHYSYGTFNIVTSVFTAFAAGGLCNTPGVICQSANDLPAVFKTTIGSFTYTTAIVPDDALIVHPGSNVDESNSIAIRFTAPRAGVYSFDGTAAISDIAPSGTNLYVYAPASGTALTWIASLGANSPTFATTTTFTLGAGDTATFIVGNAGNYLDDTTAVNLSASIAAVPDVGTWATMIAGLAMVGIASRRRRAAVTARA